MTPRQRNQARILNAKYANPNGWYRFLSDAELTNVVRMYPTSYEGQKASEELSNRIGKRSV